MIATVERVIAPPRGRRVLAVLGMGNEEEILDAAVDGADRARGRLTLFWTPQRRMTLMLGLTVDPGLGLLWREEELQRCAEIRDAVARVPLHVPVTSLRCCDPFRPALCRFVEREPPDLVVADRRVRSWLRRRCGDAVVLCP
jgi:hypothetical protein